VSGEIHKPLFVVGVMRSGTTLFYKRTVQHPDLAWLNKTSKKFPTSVWLTRLIMPFHRDRRPTEASWIWGRFARPEDDCLTREHVTEEARTFYRDVFTTQMRLQGKKRFICKYPRNMLRMDYFDAIFPDAIFIHLIRDGRAVANSMLRMRESHVGKSPLWGVKPPGWRDLMDLEAALSCGLQWEHSVRYARESGAKLAKNRYIEILYEQLVKQPKETFRRIGQACELPWGETELDRAVQGIESRNYKWKERFTPEQVQSLNSSLGSLLTELGYEV
jgi:hypothetical protein